MKLRWLRYYLLAFGLLNILVVSFTVPIFFGDQVLWHPRNVPDEMMLTPSYPKIGSSRNLHSENELRAGRLRQ